MINGVGNNWVADWGFRVASLTEVEAFFTSAGWSGYPDLIAPEDLLLDESNININWDACEKAVGKFEF